MTLAQSVRTCLSKYATFSGRASRSEYWWFILFLILGSLVAGAIDAALFGVPVVVSDDGMTTASTEGPIAAVFSLATLLPLLAAGWRRMHDTGRSGLFLIYPAIVMVGIATFVGLMAGFEPFLQGDFGAVLAGGGTLVLAIAMIVFFLSPLFVLWWLTRPSEPGANQYGPNPHEVHP